MNAFLQSCKKKLLLHGIDNAKKELEWFIEKNSLFTKDEILLNKIKINDNLKTKILNFVDRRSNQEPFQYILESSTFYGRDFYVNPSVLIPRPETETIIYQLKKSTQTFNHALDIGTGSGNLAITLSLEKIVKKVTAIDKSYKALKVAKENARQYNTKNIKFVQQDFLDDKIINKYDLIVSNPPYISIDEYMNLNKQVKNHEPTIALTDFHDGLLFYKKIEENLNTVLCDNGALFLEIGLEKQKDKINKIFNKYCTTWFKDLNGDYRVVKIKKN